MLGTACAEGEAGLRCCPGPHAGPDISPGWPLPSGRREQPLGAGLRFGRRREAREEVAAPMSGRMPDVVAQPGRRYGGSEGEGEVREGTVPIPPTSPAGRGEGEPRVSPRPPGEAPLLGRGDRRSRSWPQPPGHMPPPPRAAPRPLRGSPRAVSRVGRARRQAASPSARRRGPTGANGVGSGGTPTANSGAEQGRKRGYAGRAAPRRGSLPAELATAGSGP